MATIKNITTKPPVITYFKDLKVGDMFLDNNNRLCIRTSAFNTVNGISILDGTTRHYSEDYSVALIKEINIDYKL